MIPAKELEKQVMEWMRKNISDPDLEKDMDLRREKCIQYLDKVYVDAAGVVQIILTRRKND